MPQNEIDEDLRVQLENAWDSGYTTGKYDGLYKDFESYDDDHNPYRKSE